MCCCFRVCFEVVSANFQFSHFDWSECYSSIRELASWILRFLSEAARSAPCHNFCNCNLLRASFAPAFRLAGLACEFTVREEPPCNQVSIQFSSNLQFFFWSMPMAPLQFHASPYLAKFQPVMLNYCTLLCYSYFHFPQALIDRGKRLSIFATLH